MSKTDEFPQTEERQEGVPDNTAAQQAAHRAAEAQWEKEQTWPLWQVEILGDECEWVARPGVNLDEEGNPQSWVAPAKATVDCRAQSEDQAKMLALQHNPGYHTVTKVTKRDEEK